MKPLRSTRTASLLLALVFVTAAHSAETVRIAAFALKNFGDTKASDSHRLKFIADRIAEQAVKGICIVDELQDVDGSAMLVLKAAVSNAANTAIEAQFSIPVGSNREQFGFFWNPLLLSNVAPVQTILF